MTSPDYPVFPSQPRAGCLPSMAAMGPPDLRPSSGTAPFYQRRFDLMYGRHLAGYGEIDSPPEPPPAEPEVGTALNELRLMQELDDSSGSGIFDAPGTRPNIHPTEGVFADRMAWPGYVQRDHMYDASEVRSVATGRPVHYVNAGAVAMDDSAKVAFLENTWGQFPRPVVSFQRAAPMAEQSIANVRQNPVPAAVSGLGALPPAVNFALAAGAVGLVAGLAYGLLRSRQ